MKIVLGLLIICAVTACTTTKKMNDVSLGMTKAQVISAMGAPKSTSASGTTEYLNYRLYEGYHDQYGAEFYVRLVNGRVDSYGKLGDFDSTKDPTISVESNENITVRHQQ